MSSFASPLNSGFGSFVGGAGTPERYEMAGNNRYAYRLGNANQETQEEPTTAELRNDEAVVEENPTVFRRSDTYTRRCKSFFWE